MNIRRAEKKDMQRIHALLKQVEAIHHEGRAGSIQSGNTEI